MEPKHNLSGKNGKNIFLKPGPFHDHLGYPPFHFEKKHGPYPHLGHAFLQASEPYQFERLNLTESMNGLLMNFSSFCMWNYGTLMI